MPHPLVHLRRFAPLAALTAAALTATALAAPDDDEEKLDFDFEALHVEGAFAPAAMPAEFGATPGGAQDIAHARDLIAAGEIPHPDTFTPEGLFSEHDLPLPAARCRQTLCVTGAAAAADLIAQPDVRLIAQLGFASGLDPATWRRDPLALVAVVDKSGSMSGHPLDTVKASLHTLVDQLGPGDRLAIVLYGDRAHVHLPPTAVEDRAALHRAVDAIQSAGSTAMEDGLKVGFDLAHRTARHFSGTTRVMLFTDERPNVGATHAGSFIALARDASRAGVGLTTIGVGTHFGAELATAISSVRGGNLFFFPDADEMRRVFADELDTLVTELAYDLTLTVRARKGWRIAGLYGLPGDRVRRTPDGALEMTLETIFLSKKKGAIFIAYAPDGDLPPPHGAPGEATLSYLDRHATRYQDRVRFDLVDGDLPLGLARGILLVDQATALKQATRLHTEANDQDAAWRIVRRLRQRLETADVPGLEPELTLVAHLDRTLTRLSGRRGEGETAQIARDPVTGLPVAR